MQPLSTLAKSITGRSENAIVDARWTRRWARAPGARLCFMLTSSAGIERAFFSWLWQYVRHVRLFEQESQSQFSRLVVSTGAGVAAALGDVAALDVVVALVDIVPSVAAGIEELLVEDGEADPCCLGEVATKTTGRSMFSANITPSRRLCSK